jgi:NAD(P)-dependent dehydrogenase (short-subunit alcohol dehydrogenase family)
MTYAQTALQFAPPPGLLRDRVLLVTGAGQGMGQAVALAASAAGAIVILHGRQEAKLAATYDKIVEEGGPEPAIVSLDFATCAERDLEALALGIRKDFGRLDGLVHCAAHFTRLKPLAAQPLEESQLHMRVGLTVPLALTRLTLPLLRQSAPASVIFTGLSQAQGDMPHWGALGLGKAAIGAAARMLATELGQAHGVRVHLLIPGPADSPQRRQSHPADDFSKLRHPRVLANAYLWLLSPACDLASGKALDLSQLQTGQDPQTS